MFPQQYTTAVIAGQAIGGVFASLTRIISLAIGAGELTSASYFFMIALLVMGVTIGCLTYPLNSVSLQII